MFSGKPPPVMWASALMPLWRLSVRRCERLVARAAEFPGYGWEKNMGYGTAEHLAGLKRLGRTPLHRAHFAPVAQLELELVSAAE